MKLVLQRVRNAKVEIEGKAVASIGQGLLVLVGVENKDFEAPDKTLETCVRKLLALRCFEDEAGKMNRSLTDLQGEILLVSQFTLLGDLTSGNRPSFIKAAKPEIAGPYFDRLVDAFRKTYSADKVQTGVFQADMQVHLVNDGPVTFTLEI
jgi:D-aminoacyl-tRNA deacylase